MGTRGCVAVGTLNKWQGIYNHLDSYPVGLGKKVWRLVKENKNIFEDITQYDTFSDYLNNGICIHCGEYLPKGYCAEATTPFLEPGSDLERKYHTHIKEQPFNLSSNCLDPLHIPWVYILNKKQKTMSILNSEVHVFYENPFKAKPFHDVDKKHDKIFKTKWIKYSQSKCRYVLVKRLFLNKQEPDWEKLEKEIYGMNI